MQTKEYKIAGVEEFFAPGCNVVWQISGLSDFRRVLPVFLKKAKNRAMKTIYIRFSDQPVIMNVPEQVTLVDIPLTHRFESFTMAVYKILLEEKEPTFFVFDCLSDLQTAWATDLMMENFFRVITPMVRGSESRAFFPLVRKRHSMASTAEIRKNTELFLDLYADFTNLFLRPAKIEGYDVGEGFVPRIFDEEKEEFYAVADGRETSLFLRAVSMNTEGETDENRDAWDRFFDRAQRRYERGEDISGECERMSQIMMSRDDKIREMLKTHFKPTDYFFVREHMVGTGLIGGKACGMLIARKIVENERPDIYERFEAHDSFFVGSDVFYSYIVENDFWNLRVRQRTEEGYFSLADEFAEKLQTGVFPEKLEKQFLNVLEYYGECPIIVRSSSILEDGFGNAFAGKYESVFCMGTGTIEERLAEFENAIRTVYASTMSRSALDYRLRRGLNEKDEQMSLLVMRVSGNFYGDYYMPCAAGVGYSYSAYRFLESLDPNAGMLRLVMGLGTSAVDRTEGSYPRLVSLDKPKATPYHNAREHHKFSQRKVEVINTKTSQMERITPDKITGLMPYHQKNQLLEHDYEAERMFRERGQRREITFVSCPGLVKNDLLMSDMQGLMMAIQDIYQQPVDIEFTINTMERGEYMINLLQCRPLQVFKDTGKASIPEDIPEESLVLDATKCSMGLSQALDVDYIIYVDPIAYYEMPYNDKQKIAGSIGRVNWKLRDSGKKILLFVPGRVGTSSPELGVPAVFSDISEFAAVFEMAESKAGYNPELSYGSHMFQDLVENEILYGAIFEDEKTRAFHPERVTALPNKILDYDPDATELKDIIGLYEVRDHNCKFYHDLMNERIVCTIDPVGESEKGGQAE